MRNIDLIRQVKQQATGRWQGILASLGTEVPLNRHTACPACGGKDRFRFDDKEGNGTFICNQCGSGDGLDLVRRLFNVDVTEAAQEVAKVLAIPLTKKLVFANSVENPQPPNITAVEKATKLIQDATLGQSQYLIRKGHTCSVKLLKDGSMILPVKQGDELLGAQIIRVNGEKRFISGTKKKGGYIPVVDFTGTPETVFIAEGYATALTVSQLHEGVVLAALDEGNLLPVATWVRKHYPESRIIIAADNDVKPDEANIGKIKAEKTAKVVNGWVTLPPTKEKADWDDYRQQHGIEAAKRAFIEGLYQLENKKASGSMVCSLDEHSKNNRDPLLPFIDARNEGIFYVTPKLDKETGEIIKPEQWLCSLVEVIGQGIDDNNEQYIIFRWHLKGSQEPIIKGIPSADIGDREGWRILKASGVQVTTKSNLRATLADWFIRSYTHSLWSITKKTGWHKGAYIMPDGSVIGKPEQPVLFIGGSASSNAYAISGTAEEWRDNVAKLANNNPFMMLGIATALVAPMISLVGADSFGIHLFAQSTAGKTTTADIATSLYGEPDEQRLTWYGTPLGIANEALAHNDGLLSLDEVGQGANPKYVHTSAYTLFNGKGKIQGAKEGGNRPMSSWRSVAISTGEKDIPTFLMEAGIKVNAGQLVRLLNIPMERARDLNGLESGKAHADRLKHACRLYHGAAGRKWIDYLASHQEEAKEVYKEAQTRWAKLVPENYGEQVQRVTDRFAALEAAMILGQMVTGWGNNDCRDALQYIFNIWVAEFGTGNKEVEQIVERAVSFLNAYGMSRYAPLPYDEMSLPIRELAGYRERQGQRDEDSIIFYTLPTTFKEEIAKGFNVDMFADALVKNGILRKPAKGNRYQGKTPRLKHLGGIQQRAYIMVLIPELDKEG